MFAARFLGLLVFTIFAWMAATVPGPLNIWGTLIASSLFILVPLFYMLPTYEAWLKRHPNLTAIALVNLFLGWSVLGWVGALVWAFKKPEPVVTVPARDNSIPTAPARPTKACAFCAEEILTVAIKCKHCGSDVAA